jgi:Zn-finger domain-containing protein
MVYKDKDEAAVRWELKPRFYSKTEDRILTIIKQARCVINNPDRKLAYKVGYLEECLNSIEESIKEEVEVYTSNF